jgi:hypothetical protein
MPNSGMVNRKMHPLCPPGQVVAPEDIGEDRDANIRSREHEEELDLVTHNTEPKPAGATSSSPP